MKSAPRSKQFDDIYFSPENGLAETEHVFIRGNNLPEAWAGKAEFCIAETGFGTGLNFLATWKLFCESADKGARLDFVSFEKFPLGVEEIRGFLEPWKEQFGFELDRICEKYPALPSCHPERSAQRVVEGSDSAGRRSDPSTAPGLHPGFAQDDSFIIPVDEHVTLILVFGDVNETMPQVEAEVDCWFLDGFKPATNPEMWTPVVFDHMARLSGPGATFATYTAAGIVKRGLRDAGFTVRKMQGYGTKRDMLTGSYGTKR